MKLPKYLTEPVPEVSKCDRAGVCRYDYRCSFFAHHCRHDLPVKTTGGMQRIWRLFAGRSRT